MSVQTIKGDLLLWPQGINVICHVCNAKGKAGAGIAKALREAHPEAFTPYFAAAESNELRLGEFIVGKTSDDRRIVHLIGQDSYGTEKRHLNYEALYAGLEHLRNVLEEAGKEGRAYMVGVPYGIGCGLAGGTWEIVYAMIEAVFQASPVPIVIVKKG